MKHYNKHKMEHPTIAGNDQQKIVVIMGSTGVGKSGLAAALGSRFFKNSEIINCDKMQVYRGLDITTNKMTMQEQLGVRHHLLGVIDPTESVFTPSDFRKAASEIISDIDSRCGLPLVVGGSISLIYSLVTKQYDPNSDVLNGPDPHGVSSKLRYNCCFIWVDVCLDVLNKYLSKRVDEMLEAGMFEELVEYFRSGVHERMNGSGLGQSIGVPEFETYFKKFGSLGRMEEDVKAQIEAYNDAVRRIKENTYELAKKQVTKIVRLREAGWDVKRVDATEAFRAATTPESAGVREGELWEKHVVQPSVRFVKEFLEG